MGIKQFTVLFRFILMLSIFAVFLGCGGGGSSSDDNGGSEEIPSGEAILDIQLIDGGPLGSGGTPPAAPAGYTLLNIDLNDGTIGNYIWLYYKVGKADGSEGEPLSAIYTVNVTDNETPHGGTQLPVNLNNDDLSPNEPTLWLYATKAKSPVVRCIVVYNYTENIIKYGPPEAEGKYKIIWVQDQTTDHIGYTNEDLGLTVDAQDLNEHELGSFVFIGYGVD